ncbi:MAG: imidazole glycerol phosphate synthase subunit HisH [Ignavibacteriales bacterium]
MKIAIVDFGMGNLRSVVKKLTRLNYKPIVSSDPQEITKCDKLLLPGVGHFGRGMENLFKLGLVETILEMAVVKKCPILGICLGMQMLTNFSEEGSVKGLGLIGAQTRKFNFSSNKMKVPHIGWNNIMIKNCHPILDGISENELFYFVHSYYVKCDFELNEIAQTSYGLEFSSIIAEGNIIGVQFHPEKSHDWGEKLMKNFCEL